MYKCTKCGQEKTAEKFSKDTEKKSGLSSWCRTCHTEGLKNWALKHPEECRITRTKFYQKNRAKIISRSREYYKNNKEKALSRQKRYYKRNKFLIRRKNRKRYNKNWERIRNSATIYYKKNTEKFKLRRFSPGVRYGVYKYGAKKKGMEWNLTFEEFMTFWKKPCYYCNSSIETIGLDRIDNKKGYFVQGLVPCCRICNYAKQDLTQLEFIERCEKIVQNRKVA